MECRSCLQPNQCRIPTISSVHRITTLIANLSSLTPTYNKTKSSIHIQHTTPQQSQKDWILTTLILAHPFTNLNDRRQSTSNRNRKPPSSINALKTPALSSVNFPHHRRNDSPRKPEKFFIWDRPSLKCLFRCQRLCRFRKLE